MQVHRYARNGVAPLNAEDASAMPDTRTESEFAKQLDFQSITPESPRRAPAAPAARRVTVCQLSKACQSAPVRGRLQCQARCLSSNGAYGVPASRGLSRSRSHLLSGIQRQQEAAKSVQEYQDLALTCYQTGIDRYINLLTALTTVLSNQQTLVSLQIDKW